jgi:hypothetical protein
VQPFFCNDLNIIDLSVSIMEKIKLEKTGPHSKAKDPETVEILNYLNCKVACVNNHFKDYDAEGIDEAIS